MTTQPDTHDTTLRDKIAEFVPLDEDGPPPREPNEAEAEDLLARLVAMIGEDALAALHPTLRWLKRGMVNSHVERGAYMQITYLNVTLYVSIKTRRAHELLPEVWWGFIIARAGNEYEPWFCSDEEGFWRGLVKLVGRPPTHA